MLSIIVGLLNRVILLSEEILEEKKDTIIIYDYEDYTLVVAVTIAVKLSLKVRLRTMYIFVNAESVA